MQTIALKTPNGSKPVEATAETMLLMREAVSLGRLFHGAGYELALVVVLRSRFGAVVLSLCAKGLWRL